MFSSKNPIISTNAANEIILYEIWTYVCNINVLNKADRFSLKYLFHLPYSFLLDGWRDAFGISMHLKLQIRLWLINKSKVV